MQMKNLQLGSYCLPNITVNMVSSGSGVTYTSPVTVTTSPVGHSWMGRAAGVSFRIMDQLRARRIMQRKAMDCSFGSSHSSEWMPMTKVELTAENRPTYDNRLGSWWG